MEMESKRSIASRENGKLGGVKTDEGKLISSRNSLKHGILSEADCSYDLIKVDPLYLKLLDEFKVKSESRRMLVEQLAICYLKLARCNRFERELLEEACNTVYEEDPVETLLSGMSISNDKKATISNEWFLKMDLVLTRYEPQLVKRMINIINELKK